MNNRDRMRLFKAGIFQALAHPTRIFILESLGRDEMTVGMLCDIVGIAQSNASQHLAILRNKHIVETRKEGNLIYYRLRDPALVEVLDKMRQYFVVHHMEVLKLVEVDQKSGV